jgi:hypothetical protein
VEGEMGNSTAAHQLPRSLKLWHLIVCAIIIQPTAPMGICGVVSNPVQRLQVLLVLGERGPESELRACFYADQVDLNICYKAPLEFGSISCAPQPRRARSFQSDEHRLAKIHADRKYLRWDASSVHPYIPADRWRRTIPLAVVL